MAKKFKFRLEKLLKVRRTREKLALAKLVALKVALEKEKEKLRTLQQRETALIARMTPHRGQAIDIQELEQCRYAIEKVQKQQSEQEFAVQAAAQAVVDQEKAVSKARQDVKVLEELREQQLLEFKAEMLREEQVFLDDIAGQMYSRKRRTEAEEKELA